MTRTHKCEHTTPVLNSMQWLKIIYRSKYNIPVNVYKALDGTDPLYIEELGGVYHPRSPRFEPLLTIEEIRGGAHGNRFWKDCSNSREQTSSKSLDAVKMKTSCFKQRIMSV